MLRHPESERHVSSYTTLVPSRRTTGDSCSECVSGSLAALLLDGCPFLVGCRVAAGYDVGEVLRRARPFVEVGHVVGGRKYSVRIRCVLGGVGGIAAQVGDPLEFSGVFSIFDNGA